MEISFKLNTVSAITKDATEEFGDSETEDSEIEDLELKNRTEFQNIHAWYQCLLYTIEETSAENVIDDLSKINMEFLEVYNRNFLFNIYSRNSMNNKEKAYHTQSLNRSDSCRYYGNSR